jgi:hypothetical protein
VDVHFNPSYDPWDQRVCLVPDGDFFAAVRSRKAEVVTGHIKMVSNHLQSRAQQVSFTCCIAVASSSLLLSQPRLMRWSEPRWHVIMGYRTSVDKPCCAKPHMFCCEMPRLMGLRLALFRPVQSARDSHKLTYKLTGKKTNKQNRSQLTASS